MWEWIYIQQPFVELLMDCWALKNGTACKYADATQRKRHSHASAGSKVSDISRRREKRGKAACSSCPWRVLGVYMKHVGQDNWSINAAEGQIIRGGLNDAGCLNFTGFSLLISASTHHLTFLCDSVCCRCDRSSWTLTKFLSAWWVNSGFRALYAGLRDIISLVMDRQDRRHVCS